MRSLVRSVPLVMTLAACGGAPPPDPVPPPVAIARPKPRAEPELPSELTGELVRPVLAKMDGAVSGCYALEYGGQQDAGGHIVLHWLIAPSGRVQSARIVESSFQNANFERCVLEEAKSLEFPAAKQPTELNKPYHLQREGGKTASTEL